MAAGNILQNMNTDTLKSEHARQLERELAEARKLRDLYKESMEVAREQCDILQDELAESEKTRQQLAYVHVFAVERAQQYEDQRDTLAEALRELLDALGARSRAHELIGHGVSECRAQEIIALAAVKGVTP